MNLHSKNYHPSEKRYIAVVTWIRYKYPGFLSPVDFFSKPYIAGPYLVRTLLKAQV